MLTPGDNEWTDCHRAAAGGYLPTERLARLREVFYPKPKHSLGKHRRSLDTQADEPGFGPFVENRMWKAQKVVFSTVHVVGSNNGLAPWFGSSETPEQRAQRLAEYEARLAAALAWLDDTFERAADGDARGVVVAMQADMWDGTPDGVPRDRPAARRPRRRLRAPRTAARGRLARLHGRPPARRGQPAARRRHGGAEPDANRGRRRDGRRRVAEADDRPERARAHLLGAVFLP